MPIEFFDWYTVGNKGNIHTQTYLSGTRIPKTFLSSSRRQCIVFHCQGRELAKIHRVSVEYLVSHLHTSTRTFTHALITQFGLWVQFSKSAKWEISQMCKWTAMRSVMLNLANKFSQCSFSIAEHYDLFSDLIILHQSRWCLSYDDIPHRTDRETAAGKAQCYHTDLKLIYMLPIMPYTTSRQFRVDGHFKSVWNNWCRLHKTAMPTC